jgi:hypothetical protein
LKYIEWTDENFSPVSNAGQVSQTIMPQQKNPTKRKETRIQALRGLSAYTTLYVVNRLIKSDSELIK